MKKVITLSISIFSFIALLVGTSVEANAQCKADFQYSVKCNTVEFFDSSSTSGVMNTYRWDFGDGQSGQSYYEKHTYAKTGTYTVKLYVISYDSFRKVVCRDSATKTVTVRSICCKAAFTYQINGLDVYFSNNSTPGTTATWDFGDGTTTGTRPHKYAKAGTYNVCLKITDSSSNCKDSICQRITVQANSCKAGFTWTQPDTTKPVIKFTNTSTPSGLNYSWSFGDGTSGTSANPTHTYKNGGRISACLTVYDSSRTCYDRYCAIINIKGNACVADFSYSGGGNNIIYFSNRSTANKQYKWTFGDGKSSTTAYPKHQYAKSGTYTVCLYVSDSSNNCSDSICKTVKVDSSSCDASFTFTLDTTTNSVTFTPKNNDTNAYHSWFVNRGQSIGNSSGKFTQRFPKGGTFTVCHYVMTRDSNSFCSDTFCVSITLPANTACDGSFGFQITDTAKKIVKFTAASSGSNVKYLWKFGDGKTSTKKDPTHTYTKSQVYTVMLIVSVVDSNNRVICTDSTYKVVNLYSNQQSCQAKFSVKLDTTKKFKVWIINQSKGTKLNYYWTFGDGGSSTQKNPKHKYKTFGKYQVCLMVYDSSCRSTYCDTIGMDSTGKLLKADGFEIEVIDEGVGSVSKIDLSKNKVYPNPFTGVLYLTVDEIAKGIENVHVMDMKGQYMNINVDQQSNSSVQIDAASLPKGMYLLNFEVDGLLQTRRIMKVE